MSVIVAYLLLFILFAAFKISVSEIMVLFEIFRYGCVPGLYSTGKVPGNYTASNHIRDYKVAAGNEKENALFIV